MAHELVTAFAHGDLALGPKLREMIEGHPSHCTERRGCGLTQASRLLAGFVNAPGSALEPMELGIFEGVDVAQVRATAARCAFWGWEQGWRNLDQAPDLLMTKLDGWSWGRWLRKLNLRLQSVRSRIRLDESILLFGLVEGILTRRSACEPMLPAMAEKPMIGSCSQAEEFFLEIAHGKVRRHGKVNVFVDDAMDPVLVEKVNLGESHSAMFIAPASICGVRIEAGGLAALRYRDDLTPVVRHPHGGVYRVSDLQEVRFLRVSTLSVRPDSRARAFAMQFQRQVVGNMLSPRSTRHQDLHERAMEWLGAHTRVL